MADACQNKKVWSATRFAQVQATKSDRRRRDKHFPVELFGEPAWDILLELYAFELVSGPVGESELIDTLTVPPSVSIRWMKLLEAQNLISRNPDPAATARVRVELTAAGVEALDRYFSDED